MPDDQPHYQIPLVERYRGAVSEINTRLQARQQTYVFFATASAALLGFIANLSKDPISDSNNLDALVLIMPSMLSLAFSSWTRNHDLLISKLALFCQFAENGECKRLSWYAKDVEWQKAALASRKWSDAAMSILALLLCQTSCVLAKTILLNSPKRMWIVIGNYFCFGVVMWIVWSVRSARWQTLLKAEPSSNGYTVTAAERIHWPEVVALVANLAGILLLIPGSPFSSPANLFGGYRTTIAGFCAATFGFQFFPALRLLSAIPVLKVIWKDMEGHTTIPPDEKEPAARAAAAG